MTQAIGLHDQIKIGQATVNPVAGEVLTTSGSTTIHPHAAELLVALSNRPGEIIDRADLITEVWGEGLASDQALTHCVSELRSVLGDCSGEPQVIQTIPRRGYRLVAPVKRLGEEFPSGDAASAARPALAPESCASGEPETDTAKQRPTGGGLLAELNRRRVCRVAITYMVVAWVVTEVVATVFPIIGLPDWTVTLVVAGLAIGFPLAAALAWAFDIREGGIERSPRGPAATTPLRFVLRLAGRGLMLAAATALLIAVLVPGLVRDVISTVVALDFNSETATLAFIPLEAVPERPGVVALAASLSHEITEHLSAFAGLEISILPNDAATQSPETLAAIAPMVLSGTVSESVDRVVVTTRLVETQTGIELWSRTFVVNAQPGRDSHVVANAARSLACGVASGAALLGSNTG